MNHVFHRQPRSQMPYATAGAGPYIVDHTGKTYLDASGGAAVSCLGHNHPAVIAAIKAQLDRIPYAHTSFFTSEAAEDLADMLVAAAPDGIDRAYFVTGGSEAIEAALKLARQYFIEIGQPQRRHFVARRQSYHGNTLGALAVGGNAWRREPYLPLLIPTHHVSPCYAYREQRAAESAEEYGARLADELQAKLLELGPETVIAFIAETVVGATAGAVTAVPGYFSRVRELCDRHGILLILDEIMCGMGRTGTLFACEQEQITGDIITVAKGLGAGYQPLGAMLVSARVYQAIEQGSGFFQHGHTYMGHLSACAAGRAVQQTLRDDNLLVNVRRQGVVLRDALDSVFAEHPHVGDIRGRGLFLALELVADRNTRQPFDPETVLHTRIKREAMQRGLMVYPGAGTIDGRLGHHILLAPPYIIEERHVAEIADKLEQTLDAVFRKLH